VFPHRAFEYPDRTIDFINLFKEFQMKEINGVNVPQKNESNAGLSLQFINSKAAANYLSISQKYLYQLMHRNEISYFKPNGKLTYFSIDDLNGWIQRNRVSCTHDLEQVAINYLKG